MGFTVETVLKAEMMRRYGGWTREARAAYEGWLLTLVQIKTLPVVRH